MYTFFSDLFIHIVRPSIHHWLSYHATKLNKSLNKPPKMKQIMKDLHVRR